MGYGASYPEDFHHQKLDITNTIRCLFHLSTSRQIPSKWTPNHGIITMI